MISKRKLEREVVLNQYGEGEFYSSYAHHATEQMGYLRKVYKKELPYASFLYSTLANTLEMFYKAIIVADCEEKGLQEPHSLMHEHTLPILESYIDTHICPIQDRINFPNAYDHLLNLTKGYTDSRYNDMYEFEDFAKSFRFVDEYQKNLFRSYSRSLLIGKEDLDHENDR